jgi:hypothetical protein
MAAGSSKYAGLEALMRGRSIRLTGLDSIFYSKTVETATFTSPPVGAEQGVASTLGRGSASVHEEKNHKEGTQALTSESSPSP